MPNPPFGAPWKGIPVIGTRDDGFHFPQVFVEAFFLSLAYPVLKGTIHISLNQIQLLIREKIHRVANVSGGNR